MRADEGFMINLHFFSYIFHFELLLPVRHTCSFIILKYFKESQSLVSAISIYDLQKIVGWVIIFFWVVFPVVHNILL